MSYKGKFRPLNPKKYKGDVTNIIYRSGWERTFMSYLDRSPTILEWSSEEKIIPYFDPFTGKKRRYFMDFWVREEKDGTIIQRLVEVKPHKSLSPPKRPTGKRGQILKEAYTYGINQAKWEAATKYCQKNGWEFIIATEKTVKHHWDNIRFV